mgnify:CR=1 FL=1
MTNSQHTPIIPHCRRFSRLEPEHVNRTNEDTCIATSPWPLSSTNGLIIVSHNDCTSLTWTDWLHPVATILTCTLVRWVPRIYPSTSTSPSSPRLSYLMLHSWVNASTPWFLSICAPSMSTSSYLMSWIDWLFPCMHALTILKNTHYQGSMR